MKYSVLLPTRNRLDLLRSAVESVQRQDHQDWELIVSDNDSQEDVRGFVEGLADSRIRYVRTPAFVPVTENWNNALAHSSGDMVVMLGDDDCLLSGYFTALEEVLTLHPDPDFIYTGALLYAYPGVIPGQPQGFLHTYAGSGFLRDATAPFWMRREAARRLVERFLCFHTDYDYNMQFFVVSRRMISTLQAHGPFFQSPFPDYYAANAMMLLAERILVFPRPLVVIGISPKSFGWYYFNGKEDAGSEFLKDLPEPAMAEALGAVLLPGSHLFTSWLFSAQTLCARFGTRFAIATDLGRYRRLQIERMYHARWISGTADQAVIRRLWRRLAWSERLWIALPLACGYRLRASLPDRVRRVLGAVRRRLAGQPPSSPAPEGPQPYRTIRDVFTSIDPADPPPLPPTGG